jgi:thiol-disulfide isomerase/thioredoxin
MVDVTWKGEQSVLQVRPGAGMKISPDAPVDIHLSVDGRARTYGVDGAMVVSGLPIGGVRGAALEGEVSLQVCEDDTGICRPEQVSISGSVPGSKKGTVALNAVVHQEQKHTSPFNSDAAPVAEAAFARAKARGERVLLDFSAVWCPPCNLLAAEVLHAADAADHLVGLHVAVVDVDHPSSWELKSRYAVGSYPTVVVVDAEGNELDRMVGYPGRDAFLAFVAGADEPAPDWAAVDPTTLTPDVAATGLIRALDAHRPAQAWVEASADSDSREAHVGRFRHTPSAAELEWLMQHDVDRALDWLPHVGDWGEGEGRPLLEAAAVLLGCVGF